VDPVLVLNSVGIAIERQYGTTARAACPFHGGNNKSSFSVNLTTGQWTCFSSGCHHGYSDMIGLVQLSRRCSFKEAIEFIASLMGIDFRKDYTEEIKGALHKKEILEFTRRQDRHRITIDLSSIPNIEEEIFNWINSRSDYFYAKGYTHAIQDYFEIGFHYDPHGIPRATIPIRDSNGRFVAVDGRRIDSEDEPRYFMQPFGFTKGLVLYHYHKAKDYVKIYNGTLFLVEGYKACWSMVQAGILNTVACMGAGLTAEQPQILMRDLNLRRVVSILDGDEAGRNGSRRAKRELGHFLPIEIIDLPITDPVTDPSTMDPNQLRQILSPYF
jgi:DNA primase